MSLQPLRLDLSLSSPSLHPTITVHLHPPSTSQLPTPCDLQARLSLILPDELFLDPDELSDKSAGSAVSSYHLSSGLSRADIEGKGKGKIKVDIERPARYDIDILDQTILDLDIANISTSAGSSEVDSLFVDIPLHARYLYPTEDGRRIIRFPDPKEDGRGGGGVLRGEWYCDEEASPIPIPLPILHPTPVEIIIPTGKHSHQPLVELVTPLVIWCGWAWLVYKIFKLRSRIKNSGMDDKKRI
ncbi:uncharacterized protein I303_107450 [Kwoniella dejecticola CBS 10117]|uniref:Protein PBN1 n=1 Tax=Kwoniella dejecticola CBS 10117 TaxID=1296121 RepID=A0A1A5ZZQ2_9TREE|nr:uncharacterized protein I303_06854 [Kwoniella dejecticola CBS 10117]OBR83291.1 hypothetical protein I303_06854 [Kwoniella dejecticola CBS 10117]